jgi:hypothetical protein
MAKAMGQALDDAVAQVVDAVRLTVQAHSSVDRARTEARESPRR